MGANVKSGGSSIMTYKVITDTKEYVDFGGVVHEATNKDFIGKENEKQR